MDTRANANQAPISVRIHTDEVTADDMPLYRDTLERALRFTGSVQVERVEVYINPRGVYASTPDWLEYAIRVVYVNRERQPMTIGCIQRQPGAASEFHS